MRVSGEDAAMLAARKKLPAWNMRDQIRNVIRENKVTIFYVILFMILNEQKKISGSLNLSPNAFRGTTLWF